MTGNQWLRSGGGYPDIFLIDKEFVGRMINAILFPSVIPYVDGKFKAYIDGITIYPGSPKKPKFEGLFGERPQDWKHWNIAIGDLLFRDEKDEKRVETQKSPEWWPGI